MAKEYTIYCDESISKGEYYSDFYGGCIIETKNISKVNDALLKIKENRHLNAELKWTKVTENHLDKYNEFISKFFQYIFDGTIKFRIMFRQNAYEPVGLNIEQKANGYFLLYYQFIKHAFGLRFSNPDNEPVFLRTYFDELPENPEKKELFKNHIYAIQSLPEFEDAVIKIRRRDIADINSKDHLILQCVDIILGAMAFRLNNLHKVKPQGSFRRGKRTIAKEKLYKHIQKEIRKIYPNFNIGTTTSVKGNLENRWNYSYAHWNFKAKNYKINSERFKRKSST
jgi:hypothetical protein